jgi:hypothetical protein
MNNSCINTEHQGTFYEAKKDYPDLKEVIYFGLERCYSTLIIVACRAIMLQLLFEYIQTFVNLLVTTLPALFCLPCGIIFSSPITMQCY